MRNASGNFACDFRCEVSALKPCGFLTLKA